MLLNRGMFEGARLLSPKSVEMLTTDHVAALLDERGFGYGFGIRRSLADGDEPDSEGTYFWGGFRYGTFFVDPAEEMIGISAAQKRPGGTLNDLFAILARQAISGVTSVMSDSPATGTWSNSSAEQNDYAGQTESCQMKRRVALKLSRVRFKNVGTA